MGLARGIQLRGLLREYEFSGGPRHAVTVPAGPDGRPGERVLVPSRNAWNSEISRDGARHDCQAFLTRHGSLLLVVCLGRVTERGDPWSSAYRTIDEMSRMRTRRGVLPPQDANVAGMPAVKYAFGQGNGQTQYEWKFDHDGWLFVAGIIVRPNDDEALAVGERALSTWQWQSEVTVEASIDSTKAIGALNFTRTIRAVPEVVRQVLRTLEGQAAMRAPLVDAFVVPRRPADLGERFAFVKIANGCRRTTLLELLDVTPGQSLVTWNPLGQDENFRIRYELQPLPLRGETNVTVTVQYSVSPDAAAASRQRAAADRAVRGTLERLQSTAESAIERTA